MLWEIGLARGAPKCSSDQLRRIQGRHNSAFER
jgi:hypothetical protein